MLDSVAPWRAAQDSSVQNRKTISYAALGAAFIAGGAALCFARSTPLKGVGFGLVSLGVVCEGGALLSGLAPRLFKKEPESTPKSSKKPSLKSDSVSSSSAAAASSSTSSTEETPVFKWSDIRHDLPIETPEQQAAVQQCMIGKVEANPRYQRNPEGYVKAWRKVRGTGKVHLGVMDDALQHFEAKHGLGEAAEVSSGSSSSLPEGTGGPTHFDRERDLELSKGMWEFDGIDDMKADLIQTIKNNKRYQANPREFIRLWAQDRAAQPEEKVSPEDEALAYFQAKSGGSQPSSAAGTTVTRESIEEALQAGWKVTSSTAEGFIRSIEANADYRRSPEKFVEAWVDYRGRTEECRGCEDAALRHFSEKYGWRR